MIQFEPAHFINRELSWLEFNHRVLDEALDPKNRLLRHMAKRDPNKSARNRLIKSLKKELRELLPTVLTETGESSEAALNATLGSKNDEFFDLKNDVIYSQDQFVNQWMTALNIARSSRSTE